MIWTEVGLLSGVPVTDLLKSHIPTCSLLCSLSLYFDAEGAGWSELLQLMLLPHLTRLVLSYEVRGDEGLRAGLVPRGRMCAAPRAPGAQSGGAQRCSCGSSNGAVRTGTTCSGADSMGIYVHPCPTAHGRQGARKAEAQKYAAA